MREDGNYTVQMVAGTLLREGESETGFHNDVIARFCKMRGFSFACLFFANTEICEEKGNVFGLRFISVIIIN